MATTLNTGEFAELIEAELRGRDLGRLIPDGGLERWVNQAWEEDSDNDPGEWASAWIDEIGRENEIPDPHHTILKVQSLARESAALFVEEFGKAFDEETDGDWDATAWETDRGEAGINPRSCADGAWGLFWGIYRDTLIDESERIAPRTWTAEKIQEVFTLCHEEADEACREATRGPFNPYGDKFESLVGVYTIREAWEDSHLQSKLWPDLEDESDDELSRSDEWDDQAELIEEEIAADTEIGTGRPLIVSTTDGGYPYLFRERATRREVEFAVSEHYACD